ncbi:MAG: hypothetical protein KatS3mg095_0563 [Candidatus Parcubacteria bacterium]|nr:MAG: hypothetical protein KatS3mg095_0563 [Candidatus Parcubacteria bacterium]
MENSEKENLFSKIRKNKFLRRIFYFLLLIWLVFSIFYISSDQINKTILRIAENSYKRGLTDSVKAIIEGSVNCQTVKVFLGKEERVLIDVNCVNQKTQLNLNNNNIKKNK